MTASVLRPELGVFGPDSLTWRISREIAVLLGGGSRALLLQVAHPKIAAGVADHSRYRSDPLGRLRDTLNAICAFTFADQATVQRTLDHVHGLHARVRGQTPDGQRYSALDPHLLLWVFATLVDSSLLAYETFVAPLTPTERDVYYAECRRVGPLWGIPAPQFPASLIGLRAWMADLIDSGEVCVSPQGRHVGRFIINPHRWWAPPPVVLPLELVSVWLLPPSLRNGFGFGWGPGRERLMHRVATASRATVPRLPHLVRDLPVARAARRRVSHVA